jgi:hypothetical protein
MGCDNYAGKCCVKIFLDNHRDSKEDGNNIPVVCNCCF